MGIPMGWRVWWRLQQRWPKCFPYLCRWLLVIILLSILCMLSMQASVLRSAGYSMSWNRYLDQLGMTATFKHKVFCRQALIGGFYSLLNTTNFDPNPDYYGLVSYDLHFKGQLSWYIINQSFDPLLLILIVFPFLLVLQCSLVASSDG